VEGKVTCHRAENKVEEKFKARLQRKDQLDHSRIDTAPKIIRLHSEVARREALRIL
jgi:hypothetical protein